MATPAKNAGAGAVGFLLLLIAALAVANGTKTPAITTTTTTVATTTTISPVPSGGDDTVVLQAALNARGSLTVDAEYRVEGTIIPPRGSTITFTNRGLFRRTAAPSMRTLPVLKLIEGNVTLIRPRITGPNPCSWTYFGDPKLTYSKYDPAKEAQHAITIEGGSGYTITAPRIEAVWGDAINIDRQPTDIAITDLYVRCVGRSIISNTGSTNVSIRGGDVAGAFYWTFNIEPYNTRFVKNYTVEGVTVGFSRETWIFAGGPYFSCQVEGVRFSNITLLPPPRGVSIAACVANGIMY